MEREARSQQPPEPAPYNHGYQPSDMSEGMIEALRLVELSSRDRDDLDDMNEGIPEDRQAASNTPQHMVCPSDASEGMVEALRLVIESERNEAQQQNLPNELNSQVSSQSSPHNHPTNEVAEGTHEAARATTASTQHFAYTSEISSRTMEAIRLAMESPTSKPTEPQQQQDDSHPNENDHDNGYEDNGQQRSNYLPNEFAVESSVCSSSSDHHTSNISEKTNEPIRHTQLPSVLSEGTMKAIEIAFSNIDDVDDNRDEDAPPLTIGVSSSLVSSTSMPNPTTESLGVIALGTRRSTTPGVVHVKGRAPGQLPAWGRRRRSSANSTNNSRGSFTAIFNAGSRLFRSQRIVPPADSTDIDVEQQPQDNETIYRRDPDDRSAFDPSLSPPELVTAEVRLSPSSSDNTTPKWGKSLPICSSLFCCQEKRCTLNYFLAGGILLITTAIVVLLVFLLK